MGLQNTLNVSEVLRRLGVKGDSLGSAPLLESLRLSVNIADLADLLPPLAVPIGGAAITSGSGIGLVNSWSINSSSPGGLTVERVEVAAGNYTAFITDLSPFLAVATTAANDFAFGQNVRSRFRSHVAAAAVAPANTFSFGGAFPSILVRGFDNWAGPGQFFNIEEIGQNSTRTMSITWREYPAALSPG